MTQTAQHIYRFGNGTIDGNGLMLDLLGGKGACLAEMTNLMVPIPPGFTITTAVCQHWLNNAAYPGGVEAEIDAALSWLQEASSHLWNDAGNPLLVSVRSGAPVSMPGMMDTILNVGLNEQGLASLRERGGSMRFALDSYRRLMQMFGTTVFDVPKEAFDRAMNQLKQSRNIASDAALSEADLLDLVNAYQRIVVQHTGSPFPQDPCQQLKMAVNAVFRSWQSGRAQCYRKLNNIPESMGTAVTVQTMVFGNRGDNSGTGVGFTRNPSTGARAIFGEFLPNAQGEDIVAGTRTPLPLSELRQRMPAVYQQLATIASQLEQHYREAQDFEFTVENGRLFLLQTRTAKRTAAAAVRIAVEMVSEGMISRHEALTRVRPEDITAVLSPQLDLTSDTPMQLTQGLATSPGAAVGQIVFSADEAVARAASGKNVILLTEETTADDIHGIAVAKGILTSRGGATSHAAVVARGMGKCCITGARDIHWDSHSGSVQIGGKRFYAGEWLSLDGTTGNVFEGRLPLRPASQQNLFLETLLQWASESSSCLVRANADTPQDAITARTAHAAGIGLCRTEHMFFAPDRLEHVRAMILASSTEERIQELNLLLPMQQQDFEQLFRTMSPFPVTIRLLDPPLHEFLPPLEELDGEIAAASREECWDHVIQLRRIRQQVEVLREVNPMMGHRGCRLSLTYPEILQMQVRAILQAALSVSNEGLNPVPEILVPLVASEEEMKLLAEMIDQTATAVFDSHQQHIPYTIGAMIELPRAAICADRIANHVSFVSFGTNDLTQMTYGFSRDDARTYLDSYLQKGVLKADPFLTIDREGVGHLMEMAVRTIRIGHPHTKIGVCGEHGGDPESIKFFHSLGVDYVSCSPARLAAAQLATAQASLLQQPSSSLAKAETELAAALA